MSGEDLVLLLLQLSLTCVFPLINNVMKIRDIISENVDMGWWRKRDSMLNLEALKYAAQEEKDLSKTRKEVTGTPVYTKEVNQQTPHSTKPKKDAIKSPGYRGLVNVHVKSGHISTDRGKKLVK